jgi:peptidoglycan/LPS O-acetylase OafA/YrhL
MTSDRKVVKNQNSFNLLRLIAASAVLFSHCFHLSGNGASEPILRFTNYSTLGELAVDVFFVMSGYLVTASFLRDPIPLNFIVKRLLRIFPALGVVIVLSVLVLGPMLTSLPVGEYFAHPQTRDYLRNLFLDMRYELPGVFSNNPYLEGVNGALWTLPMEVLMYFIVLSLGTFRAMTWRGCAVALLIFAWLHYAVPASIFTKTGMVLHVMPYSALTRLGMYYFAGALCFLSREKWSTNRDVVVLSVIALALFAKAPIAETIAFLALPYLVISFAHLKSGISDRITRIGDFSYGIYLYAFPVQQTTIMLFEGQISPMHVFLISFPITVFLAFVSWHFIEKPALKLKDLWIRNRNQQLVQVA